MLVFVRYNLDGIIGRRYSSRKELGNNIISAFEWAHESILEPSGAVLVEKGGDTGGFFIDNNDYIDVISKETILRLVVVESKCGVSFNRYILAPADQNIGDDYFRNFAYELVSMIIKDSICIIDHTERMESIYDALKARSIFMDRETVHQISFLVQKEFLRRFHYMWKM